MEIFIYIVPPPPLQRKINMVRGKVSSKKISYKIFVIYFIPLAWKYELYWPLVNLIPILSVYVHLRTVVQPTLWYLDRLRKTQMLEKSRRKSSGILVSFSHGFIPFPKTHSVSSKWPCLLNKHRLNDGILILN